jgi:hypothetical protein
MIVYQNYTTESGAERVKAFSDRNVYIERDGVEYTDADDFAYQNRVYTETDKPIEGEPQDEAEQKAEAYDYLTGRSNGNE